MKRLILLIPLLSLVMASCQETDKSEKQITPVQIGQGNLYGSGQEGIPKQDIIIKTQSQWDELKKAIDKVDSFTEKEIDFNNYQIIAVFDEIKGNGGWSIDITDVTEYSDQIVVTVKNLKTGDLTSVITQPYLIVKIPVSSKKITFKHS